MFKRIAFAAVIAGLAAGVASAERLPVGTEMTVRLQTDVVPGSKTTDQFSALLSYPVFVNGHEALPAGTRVEGDVRGSKKRIVLSPKQLVLPDGRKVDFNAAVSEIDRAKMKAEEKEGTIESRGSTADAARQAAEIGMAGAGVGAMTTGSVKGMGIGAAAGVAAVLIGRKIWGRGDSSVIPAGTQLTMNLSRELEIPDDIVNQASQPRTPPAGHTPGDRDNDRPILRRR